MSDPVRMPRALADEMIAHCLEGRPNEACGILATADGTIVKVFGMANASASPVRYSLDPKEQLFAYNAIDEAGWELGGVFHSHTRTEAYPSPTDVREAFEDVPYLIVSLRSEPFDIRAFRIVKQELWAETGDVVEVDVHVVEE